MAKSKIGLWIGLVISLRKERFECKRGGLELPCFDAHVNMIGIFEHR